VKACVEVQAICNGQAPSAGLGRMLECRYEGMQGWK